MLVVLDTIILVPNSEIQRQTRPNSPGVIKVSVPILIPVAARKVRRPHWQCQSIAGKLSLRVDRGLKDSQIPQHKIIQARGLTAPAAQLLSSILIGAERAVIANVNKGSAKRPLLLAHRKAQVLVYLAFVLRTTKRDRVTRRKLRITGERKQPAVP